MAEVKRVKGPASRQVKILTQGLQNAEGRVGWFESARYEDGTYIAGVAAVQELGSPKMKIPPRSFIRTTAMEQRRAWMEIVRKGAAAVANGKNTADEIMELLAMRASGDIRKKITQIWSPPLRPGTIRARIRRTRAYQNLKTRSGKIKRSTRIMKDPPKSLTKPLVDQGIMLDTLTYTVKK